MKVYISIIAFGVIMLYTVFINNPVKSMCIIVLAFFICLLLAGWLSEKDNS